MVQCQTDRETYRSIWCFVNFSIFYGLSNGCDCWHHFLNIKLWNFLKKKYKIYYTNWRGTDIGNWNLIFIKKILPWKHVCLWNLIKCRFRISVHDLQFQNGRYKLVKNINGQRISLENIRKKSLLCNQNGIEDEDERHFLTDYPLYTEENRKK